MAKHSPKVARILEAIQEVFNSGALPSRESLLDLLEPVGISLKEIDNATRELVDAGEIVRVQRGVFMPAASYREPRIVTQTLLPDGTVKLEVGDDMILLTPREKRMVAEVLGGAALQSASVDLARLLTVALNGQSVKTTPKQAAASELATVGLYL